MAILSEETTLEERGPALAGWNGTTGIWGIAAPLRMSLLVGAGILTRRRRALGHRGVSRGRRRGAVPRHRSRARRSVRQAVTDSRMANGLRGLRSIALGR